MAMISVENAQINTVGIEVKSLTLNGKQVTLSVFKQIIEEDLIDADNEECDEEDNLLNIYEYNGEPWGIVHYFWQKEIKEPNDYLHVLWQKGKELRRCVIKKDKSKFIKYLKDYKYEISHQESEMDFLKYYRAINKSQWEKIDPDHNFTQFEVNLKYIELHRSKEEYNEVHNKYLELKKIRNEKMESIKKEIENLDKIFLPLLELPQLFIAV